MEWTQLAQLACNSIDVEHLIMKRILLKLGDNITKFNTLLLRSFENDLNDESRINISFYARNILESVCTALLCRLDPYRVMITYKVQSSQKYDVTKKSNVAIQWSGDIIANGINGDLWRPDYNLEKYERALLSNHSGDLFWKTAFLNTIDFLQINPVESEWISRLSGFDEHQFFEMAKTTSMKIFSAFSKSIHHEFLINEESILDYATIQTYIDEMFFILSSLCLTGYFNRFEKVNLCNKEEALQNYISIEEEISNGNIRK